MKTTADRADLAGDAAAVRGVGLSQTPQELTEDEPELGGPLIAEDLVADQALTAAKEDRFNHGALARRVTELASCTEVPLNVGLFGSWGSGKSSVAGLIRERLTDTGVGFVYYDAWKYGGESLRRNFITHAATELGLTRDDDRWHRFHRGLYETSRRAEFRPGSLAKAAWPVMWRFFVVFAALVLLFAVAAGAASTLTSEDFSGEIQRSVPPFLQAGAIVAFVLAAAKVVFDIGRVDVEQSAPSDDEEFSDTFKALIQEARTASKGPSRIANAKQWLRASFLADHGGVRTKETFGPYERLVFFIDELDRCSEEDVVETLVAIRTFLDEDHCAFIVAADRDVLETALDRKLKQATPTNKDNPYYTTAGAFLDKVFGHQLGIPPLRGRRLTRYARDLVRNKGGLWSELVEAEGSAQLDPVVYALIPSHVRSPRRIKVLLNNFVTNARIAEARGILWPDRAQEIAKLTGLQTEFPGLAADLVLEPRLPTFLLHPPDSPSDRANELLERHRLDADNDAEDLDVYLERDDADSDQAEDPGGELMRQRHRGQLRRYLERTAEVQNPQRDLLYLEAAGAAVGLEDPELGENIEDFAPEDPDKVIAAIQDRVPDERRAAARLLADMVQDTVSTEQSNVMTVLMTVVAALAEELSADAAREVNDSLKLFSREHELLPQHLPGALAVALRVRDDTFASQLSDRDALWSSPEQVSEVAMMLPGLPEPTRQRLFTEVANTLRGDQTVLLGPASDLAEPDAVQLLGTSAVRTELGTYLADAGMDQVGRKECVSGLLAAALHEDDPRDRQLDLTLGIVLGVRDPVVDDVLVGRADAILTRLRQQGRGNAFVLRVWQEATPEDWESWHQRIDPRERGNDSQVDSLLATLISHFGDLSTSAQSRLAGQVSDVVDLRESRDAGPNHPALEALNEQLSAPAWADDSESREREQRLHEVANALRSLGGEAPQRLDELLASDLIPALEAPAGPYHSTQPLEALRGAEIMGQGLHGDALIRVVSALPEFDPDADADEASAEVSARALLTKAAAAQGLEFKSSPFGVAQAKVVGVARTRGTDYDDALGHWLQLAPTVEEIKPVAAAVVPRCESSTKEGLIVWSQGAMKTQRTALIQHLFTLNRRAGDWMAAIATEDVNESKVVGDVRDRLLAAPNNKARMILAKDARALRLDTQRAGQVLSDTACDLLAKGRPRSDILVAARLVAAIPPSHVKRTSLGNAFKKACERHDYKVSKEEASILARQGVPIPSKALGKRIEGFLSSLRSPIR